MPDRDQHVVPAERAEGRPEAYAFVGLQDLRGLPARLGLSSVPAEVLALSAERVQFLTSAQCYPGRDTVLELVAPGGGFRHLAPIPVASVAPCAAGGFAVSGRFKQPLGAEDLLRLLPRP
jgi:hypothetical protein